MRDNREVNRSALLALSLLASAGPSGAAAPAPLDPWLGWLERAEALLSRTDGYTVVYHKRELIKDTLLPEDVMRLKFMKPFNVYIEWVNPDGDGGEAIYVEGWNENRIRVHPGGFWGILTFNLVKDSRWIRRTNRHPITEVGLHSLVGLIGSHVRRGHAAGEFASRSLGEEPMFGRRAQVLEGVLPADPAKGYYCRRAVIHVDAQLALPLRLRVFDWDDRLVEEYGYEDFKPDVTLSAVDFDPANPGYRF